MPFLFRIEDENNIGPYRSDVMGYSWQVLDHYDKDHPGAYEHWYNADIHPDVSELSPAEDEVFGFADLKQCVKWFCLEEIEALKELGARFVVYWVKYIRISKEQSSAVPTKYKRVMPWEEVLYFYKQIRE